MPGIEAAAVVVPDVALTEDTIAALGGSGRRRVAGVDEDAITLGLSALEQVSLKDGVAAPQLLMCVAPTALGEAALASLASVTGLIAAPLSLLPLAPNPTGVVGLIANLATAPAGTLAVVVDHGETDPETGAPLGDGAVALRSGEGKIASLVAVVDHRALTFDNWTDQDGRRHAPEDRFVEHALQIVANSLLDSLRKAAALPEDAAIRVVCAPPTSAAARSIRRLGSAGGTASEKLDNECGGGSLAGALRSMLAELAAAGPDEYVAVLGMDYGGVGVLFSPGASNTCPTTSEGVVRDFAWYLRSRGLLPRLVPELATSPAQLWREAPTLYGLIGHRCDSCGQTSYPAERVICDDCGSANVSAVPLQRTGTVLTETVDWLFPAGEREPLQMVALELDGGGRFFGQAASGSRKLNIGDRGQLVIRRLADGVGMPHYFWRVVSI